MLEFLRRIATEENELNNTQKHFITFVVMLYVFGMVIGTISGFVGVSTGWELRPLIITIVGGVMFAVGAASMILLLKFEKKQVS